MFNYYTMLKLVNIFLCIDSILIICCLIFCIYNFTNTKYTHNITKILCSLSFLLSLGMAFCFFLTKKDTDTNIINNHILHTIITTTPVTMKTKVFTSLKLFLLGNIPAYIIMFSVFIKKIRQKS